MFRTVIAAPILCLGVLSAMAIETRYHLPPADVAPYHAAVKAIVDQQVPYFIGTWTGKDEPIPPGAQKLLKPNAIVSRSFVDNSTDAGSRRGSRWASLLIEQCKDSSDMDGHWPPNCYPARGEIKVAEDKREWIINGMKIPLTEYHFVQSTQGRDFRRCVYNFLVVPHKGLTREMDDVRAAATDYRQRFFGAAQVQVVMDGDLPQLEREEIFVNLMTPIIPVIKAINSGGQQ